MAMYGLGAVMAKIILRKFLLEKDEKEPAVFMALLKKGVELSAKTTWSVKPILPTKNYDLTNSNRCLYSPLSAAISDSIYLFLSSLDFTRLAFPHVKGGLLKIFSKRTSAINLACLPLPFGNKCMDTSRW